MNVVPFLCPMALNLHQKRPSSVTFGRLFHRTIRREIVAPSFVLMGDGARKLPPWGLYFFNFSRHFTIDAHFRECVNHDDAMPWMVACDVSDSTQKESTTPKGVASASHLPPRVASYRRQPWAIESTTPMGLPYHHPLITTPQHDDGPRHGIYHHATIWGVTKPFRWGCPTTNHLLPHHNARMAPIMAIYHHATTRGVPMPERRIACRMAIHRQATA